MKGQRLITELAKLPPETEWLEFKKNDIEPEAIGEYISALSNAACLYEKSSAYLIFGVEYETHKLVGTSFNFKKAKIGNEKLESWLNRLLTPRIDFRVEELDIDQKHFVIFTIDAASDRPISFKNNEFIRVGSYKKKLHAFPERERKIWDKQNTTLFETKIAMPDCSGDEVLRLIDYSAYFDLLSLSLPSDKSGIVEKIAEEKFIIKNEKGLYDILNLGAILFAKDLHEFDGLSRKVLRVILYKENDRLETIKEWESKKGYAISYSEIVDYVIDQLPQNELIERATRRKVKMYPDLSIRELVANALIHQDFNQRGTSPMLEIFKNRVEITNPGKPLIDTLRFIDHIPTSRNEKLASFFRRVEFCEERGSGIDKVIRSIEAYQLPAPNFIEADSYLRVMIYAHKTFKGMERKDKIRACYQHCCLKYVSGDIATNKSLRERFEVSETNYPLVSKIITGAISEGLIKSSNPESKSRKYASYIPFWA